MQPRSRKPAPICVLTSVNEAVLFKAEGGAISPRNCAAAEIFDCTDREVIDEKDEIIFPPDEMRCCDEFEKRLQSRGEICRINAVRKARNGIRIGMKLTAILVDGNCPDVSDIVENYHALNEQERPCCQSVDYPKRKDCS